MNATVDPTSLVRTISLFLDRHWDPIGVYSFGREEGPPPGTEYERYAAHVLGMLQRGETAASISHYLNTQATRSMRVGPGPTKAVAVRLHDWWNSQNATLPLEG